MKHTQGSSHQLIDFRQWLISAAYVLPAYSQVDGGSALVRLNDFRTQKGKEYLTKSNIKQSNENNIFSTVIINLFLRKVFGSRLSKLFYKLKKRIR